LMGVLPHLLGRTDIYVYQMTESEFHKYLNAQSTYEKLCWDQEEEIEEAYEDIHPTRCGYDYEQGRTFSESINVADYAIYLVDLKDKHKKERKLCEDRIRVFGRAWDSLTNEERFIYNKGRQTLADYENYHVLLDKIKNNLEKIVSTIPELQKKDVGFSQDEIARYDAKVDKMSMSELLEVSDTDSQGNVLKSLNPTESNFFERFSKAAAETSKKIAY
jgi:hypothetical protein